MTDHTTMLNHPGYVVTQKRKATEFFRFNADDMGQVIAFANQCVENGDIGIYRVRIRGLEAAKTVPVAVFLVGPKKWTQLDRHA